MRYMVVIERGEASWGAQVPDLPGCIAVGQTREDVLRLIGEAIDLHIHALGEDGAPIPPPSSEGEFVEVGAAGLAHLIVGKRHGRGGLRPHLARGSNGRYLEVLAEDRRGGPDR